MIILRYLTLEIIHVMLAIVAILLVITFSNMFVHYLSQAAVGSFLSGGVLQMMLFMLPRYLSFLLPISFFLAILLAYGKLFSNNELVVLFSCGMSWKRLAKITMLPGVILMVCVAILSWWLVPHITSHQDALKALSVSNSNISMVKPGRFVPLSGGRQVVYVQDSSATHTSKNLFIYRHLNPKQAPQVVVAPRGMQYTDPHTGSRYMMFEDGYQYKALSTAMNYQVLQFKTYGAKVAGPSLESAERDLEAMPTMSLFGSKDKQKQAELAWRLSLPFTVIVLGLLALAMCHVRPRQGRYAKLLPAVMVFVVYFNLLSVGRVWIAAGELPSWMGLWPIHLVFLLGAVYMLKRRDSVQPAVRSSSAIKRFLVGS
jgi:lipopolysaccharide export system permease protein